MHMRSAAMALMVCAVACSSPIASSSPTSQTAAQGADPSPPSTEAATGPDRTNGGDQMPCDLNLLADALRRATDIIEVADGDESAAPTNEYGFTTRTLRVRPVGEQSTAGDDPEPIELTITDERVAELIRMATEESPTTVAATRIANTELVIATAAIRVESDSVLLGLCDGIQSRYEASGRTPEQIVAAFAGDVEPLIDVPVPTVPKDDLWRTTPWTHRQLFPGETPEDVLAPYAANALRFYVRLPMDVDLVEPGRLAVCPRAIDVGVFACTALEGPGVNGPSPMGFVSGSAIDVAVLTGGDYDSAVVVATLDTAALEDGVRSAGSTGVVVGFDIASITVDEHGIAALSGTLGVYSVVDPENPEMLIAIGTADYTRG